MTMPARIRGQVVGRAIAGLLLLLLAGTSARLVASPSATPLVDWLFPSVVTTTARAGNRIYVGGWFRSARPSPGLPTTYLQALSPVTGAIVPSGIPYANGDITAFTADGSGGYFVAGWFTSIGSSRVAHVLADGTVDPGFHVPGVIEGTITQLVRVGPSLVAGGTFLHVDSVFRPLFAMNPVTGALSPWAPVLPNGDTVVRALVSVNGLLIALTKQNDFGGAVRYVTAYDSGTGNVVWQTDVTGAPGVTGRGMMGLSGGRLIVALDRLYALNPLTGAVDPAWAAGMPAAVGPAVMAIGPSAIYIGGNFTTFWGQPRGNLAAVDPATGALLPWAPVSLNPVAFVTLSPNGGVFAATQQTTFTINGQVVGQIAEIDAAGAVTSFRPGISVDRVEFLQMSPTNTLFVSGFSGYIGEVARSGLVGFDLTTGALLPGDITLSVAGGTPRVEELLGVGDVLYVRGAFDTVNGRARAGVAAIDVTTNTVLPWPAPGVTVAALTGLATSTHVYVTLNQSNQYVLRRVDATTGVVDPAWNPTVLGAVVLDRGQLWVLGAFPNVGQVQGTFVGTLDAVTGAYYEVTRTSVLNKQLRLDGDTLYLAGAIPGSPNPFAFYYALFAFDRHTGTPVFAPPVSGDLGGFEVIDGRVVVAGGALTVAGQPRYGVLELQRSGAATAWNSGFVPEPGPVSPSTVLRLDRHGDVFAAASRQTGSLYRVAVFGILGANAPAALRSQLVGQDTVFSWDPLATPPAGGYVIEGGFAAGQTAAALPVGNATSVTLPIPAGPAFIRVRAAGSSEVSNEVVAGCVAPPLPPTALTTTLSGINLTLSWTAPSGPVTNYTLLAGTAAGQSNVATLSLGPQTSVSGPVPGGTFFARVTASNACGTSGSSGEVFFTIGAAEPLPAAPTNLTSSVSGSTLTLSWTAPAGQVTGYLLEAGSAPGLANIGAATVGAATSFVIPGVPPGVYYVRVRAVTSAGTGAPSSDVVVVP